MDHFQKARIADRRYKEKRFVKDKGLKEIVWSLVMVREPVASAKG